MSNKMQVSASSYFFKKTNNINCTKSQLSPPWSTAQSKTHCLTECKTRFQDRCTNVVFNTDTHACTPVHPKSRFDPIPVAQPGDVVYSQDYTRVLNCDTVAGFQLYQHCGAAACLRLANVRNTYQNAKADCEGRDNATVYMPDSYERYAMLENIVSQHDIIDTHTWVGLTRQEGDWVWDNGEAVGADFLSSLWAFGQPNNAKNEDCVFYWFGNNHKLHDAFCPASCWYLCEQNI
ncbi:C-type lectin [Elysia marginata]|uniref:C-type lectin n=1 Tax=Elysia marginata TaxID=1093978 RepID=A0AAV4H8Y2_9GAST|nr:C-type lectin [Elysia marginata]